MNPRASELDSRLHVVIDGQQTVVPVGSTILSALTEAGIRVPTLCHDARLEPAGVCRSCLVEVRGMSHPVPACTTRLADGMEIDTHTPALEHARRGILELLAWKHPKESFDVEPVNDFLREIRAYRLEGELRGHDNPEPIDESHPYIRVDMSRCIECRRCVRICNELQGQFVWQVQNRGDRTRIVPGSGGTLRESACVSCGACVDTCPTGALEDRTVFEDGPALSFTRTTCPYCGVGCEMNVGTRGDRIVQVKPVLEAPVNKGHLCVKGRYAFEFIDAPDRVTSPMIRGPSGWRTVTWDEALAHVARRFAEIRGRYGPDAIGVLGSARATNEENYVAQKFARIVLGTNNVDCCARVCHAPSAAGLRAVLGTGAATNSFDDIERARTLLVFGSNATENHPIVGARIRQAALRGARLIVVDPRRTELAEIADVHLQLRAGTNIALLNALASVIVSEDLVDTAFVAARVADFDEFRAFVADFSPERAQRECGVEAELIRRAARLYALEKPAMCFHGLGVTEHVQGTDAVMALANLALLTGNLGAEGTGVNPLRGQNNVQGSAHMGCEPDYLTGFVELEKGRTLFEQVWEAPLPSRAGQNLMQMMDAGSDGKLKALYAIGYDVLLTNPNAHRTRESLSALDFLVVQDLFLNETAKDLAHVFLPAAGSYEKEGTFMNSERRVQRVRRVLAPRGEARADWEIVCALAQAMKSEKGFHFASAEEIWNEVRQLWKAGAGISYARLEQGGLQWPCPAEDHPGTRVLHVDGFAHGGRAALRRVETRDTLEVCDDEYPLRLVTGRKLYQFNAGTMTGRTRNRELRPSDTLDVSPSDARRFGVARGDRVRLRSRHGETTIRVNVDPCVQPGELFATFHEAETFLNRVTGPGRDSVTATPEYKVTAVRIDPANAIRARTGATGAVVASDAPYVPQGTGVSPSQGGRR